ncbi:MAG: response regulator [Candidatus Riflebacteria bacterium]|nr:response regulator [Candidatus Riflebacteria bacterium]
MTIPLKLLIVEDSKADALLLLHELQRGDFDITYCRVDNPTDLISAIEEKTWDIIISDYVMPQFSGLRALKIVQERKLDVPFIIVTDKIAEGIAVEVMKAGAHDYLRKGNLSRLVPVVNREITEARQRKERKTSEETLRKLSYAVEQSSAIVMITDIDEKIEYVNPEFTEVTGYSSQEVIGKSPSFLASGDLPEISLKEILAAKKNWKGEFLNRRKNGELYWEYAEISPALDSEGNVLSYVKIAEDITEKKRINEELKKARDAAESASKAKTQFLANVSHELRTPLNGIIGMTELLLELSLGPKEREYSEIVRSSACSLLNIVGDIIDLAKVESNQLVIDEIPFEPSKLIRDILPLLEGILFKKNLKYEIKLDPAIPDILIGDSRRIRQVLLALVGNAVKFTIQGGINISASAGEISGDVINVLFSVKDTGIGITPEHCEKLFRPFEQIDGSFTRKYGGLGTGLVLTQYLVNLLHGTIGVKSEPGTGSDFFFSVPLKYKVAEISSSSPVFETAPVAIKAPETSDAGIIKAVSEKEIKKSVIVAEDDPVNQFLIFSQITKLGYGCQVVSNGQLALELLAEEDFKMIIMDCQMPVMDGLTATRVIRKLESEKRNIPIVALTAHVSAEDRCKCIECGMNDFMSKPVSLVQLREILKKYMN